MKPTSGTPLRGGPGENVLNGADCPAEPRVPLDRLSPGAAVAAWLVSDPGPEVAQALTVAIRKDARIELDPDEIAGVIADARTEGLDPEQTFDRLILQGEWSSLNRLARIRPR